MLANQPGSKHRPILFNSDPQTLAECDYLGFDIPAWIGRELVDFVVPSDFSSPISTPEWRNLSRCAQGRTVKSIRPSTRPSATATMSASTT